MRPPTRPWLPLALLALGAGHASAQGEPDADAVTGDAEVAATATPETPSSALDRWAGSRINLLNQANVWELDRSNSLTWNPYYAVGIGIAPRFRVLDALSVGASISVVREITESDITTAEGEWWFDDLTLSASTPGITLPGIGTRIGAGLAFSLPTSKPSQAATLQLGIRPSISVSHRFPVLEGLGLSYSGSLRVNLHEFTTPSREAPLIPTCRGAECAELSHTGVRNTRWQHGHRVGLSLSVLDWLTVGGGVGLYVSHLYDLSLAADAADPTVAPAHERYAQSADAELTVGPFRGLSVGLGVSSFHPQLAPDQTAYTPFYNRFTQAYLDLRLDIAGLLTSEEG